MNLNVDLAERFYAQACEAEPQDPSTAAKLYQRALEVDVFHADSHVNLGRLLQEAGELEQAEMHYRFALFVRPEDLTASFNLATLLEDRGITAEAILQYQYVLELEPSHRDAHFNLSRLLEKQGDVREAFRHLKEYRQLLLGGGRAAVALA